MKKLVIGFITGMVLFIGAAAIAYANDWITFNGDNQIIETESDIDEIMQILRDVNTDKLTAEQAVKELQDLNPKGLAKQNQELRGRVNELKEQLETAQGSIGENAEYIKHLESEIERANNKVTELNNKSGAALQEAQEIGGNE